MFEIIWLFFIIAWLAPALQNWMIHQSRAAILRRFHQERGSRVITLIHRQESQSLLGLFTRRHIDIEDSERVLRAIRNTPPDMPIDLILHTPGGLVLASEQIARALRRHPARTAVFIPHYAMSGGTMIALAADELWMDENAVAGPVDPQVGGYPAASILQAVEMKNRDRIDDRTLILADVARKAIRQVEETMFDLLNGKYPEEKAGELAKTLTSGRWTHDYPLTCQQLSLLGIEVRRGLPDAVYRLMELYPQPPGHRPSVTYSPVPARGEPEGSSHWFDTYR